MRLLIVFVTPRFITLKKICKKKKKKLICLADDPGDLERNWKNQSTILLRGEEH